MKTERCKAVRIGAPVGCVRCGNCDVDFPKDEPDYSLKYERDYDGDGDDCGDYDGDE